MIRNKARNSKTINMGKTKSKKGRLMFDLEDKVFDKSSKKSTYDKSLKPKYANLIIPEFKGKKSTKPESLEGRTWAPSKDQVKFQRKNRNRFSCPIKVTKLRCIDGKFIKRSKDKVKSGKVKNKKGIGFDL